MHACFSGILKAPSSPHMSTLSSIWFSCKMIIRWLPALTHPICCLIHKHEKIANKSLSKTIKQVLSFMNLTILEPIMLPRKATDQLFLLVTWTNPYCKNLHLKLDMESVLPNGHSCFPWGKGWNERWSMLIPYCWRKP